MRRVLSWRSFSLFAGLLLSLFVFATSAAADGSMPVVDPACSAADSLLSVDSECLSADPPTPAAAAAASPTSPVRLDDSLPPNCRLHAEAVFWTATDWPILGEELAANPSPCGDYYISIPPLSTDKTRLRVLQDDFIRALGPRFHPVAELTLGGPTGWAAWVAVAGRTWFGAGVEFRKRMADAGYRFDLGETWLLNEFDRSTRRDEPVYTRAAMKELLRGLYYGRHRADGPADRRDRHRLHAPEHPRRRGLQGGDESVVAGLRLLGRRRSLHLRLDERGVSGHALLGRCRNLQERPHATSDAVHGACDEPGGGWSCRDRSSPGAVRPRVHAARERHLGGKRARGARPLLDSVLLRPRLDADAA